VIGRSAGPQTIEQRSAHDAQHDKLRRYHENIHRRGREKEKEEAIHISPLRGPYTYEFDSARVPMSQTRPFVGRKVGSQLMRLW
jgi:hypothetical protein